MTPELYHIFLKTVILFSRPIKESKEIIVEADNPRDDRSKRSNFMSILTLFYVLGAL